MCVFSLGKKTHNQVVKYFFMYYPDLLITSNFFAPLPPSFFFPRDGRGNGNGSGTGPKCSVEMGVLLKRHHSSLLTYN